MIAKWWQNHWSSKAPATGPVRFIYLEQVTVYRVRWQQGDEPSQAQEFGTEQLAREFAAGLQERAGGEWSGGDQV